MDLRDPALWRRLLETDRSDVREAAAAVARPTAADVTRLRRAWPADLVAAALELAAARRAAAAKFPGADDLVADVAGVEQATSDLVATHKARRFERAGLQSVTDLCCGIGGDAMALARVARVHLVDRDPLRAWMAQHNAGGDATVADVEALEVSGRALHIDPARRDAAGRRTWRLEDMRPGPDVLRRLLADNGDAAVKLGPGADLEAVEALAPAGAPREVEVINEHGTLVQAILWTGRLAEHPGARTATKLPESETFTGPANMALPGSGGAIGRYLVLADPAIERTGLTGALLDSTGADPAELAPGLGVLTGDHALGGPWFSAYEVLHSCPWREKALRAWLREHDGGIVAVKTRGGAVRTDAAQRALRGDGSAKHVVFGLRVGRALTAVIARQADQDKSR